MQKMFSAKNLCLFVGFIASTVMSQVEAYPLEPCRSYFTIHGGISPTVYSSRCRNEVLNIVSSSDDLGNASQFIQTESVKTPQFYNQFNLPWTVGAEFSIATSCDTEVFFEGNYFQAKGKKNSYTVVFPEAIVNDQFSPLPEETIKISEKYDTLRSWDFHVGVRYYFLQFCGGALFFGAKIGARHWDEVDVKFKVQNGLLLNDNLDTGFQATNFDAGSHTFNRSQTVVSGGLQLGLLFEICPCMAFILKAEALASGGFNSCNNNITLFNRDISTDDFSQRFITTLSVPVRRAGSTIFTFPVTAGIRWTF